MVKAYTLSDKISQMNYNDFESLVGVVFRRDPGGSPTLSSMADLNAAGATSIPTGQVASFFISVDEYNSYELINGAFNGAGGETNSSLITRIFDGWSSSSIVQWIQVRGISVNAVYDPTSLANPPAGLGYKIVVDAFTSAVEP